MRLSKNFSLYEAIDSATARRLKIDNTAPESVIPNLKATAINILEPVRSHFSTPIKPTSWYRCKRLNDAVCGATSSQHVTGQAVDFTVKGSTSLIVASWIRDNIEFDQLILEAHPSKGMWVHCSYVLPSTGKVNRKQVRVYAGGHYMNGLVLPALAVDFEADVMEIKLTKAMLKTIKYL